MKTCLFTILLFTAIAASSAFGQDTIKLFDATPITPTDYSSDWGRLGANVFASKDVYLSCPAGGTNYAYVTGPDNGNLFVDNFMMMNGDNICPNGSNCFAGTFASPMLMIGQSMQSTYLGVAPIDISSRLKSSGVYTFELADYSYAYGNSDIYLHTSCTFGTYVCHRNNGSAAPKTLAISGDMLAAHLGHGDKEGPCD
ncbi:MAG TPA: hypothetical protein VEV84_03215 [Pyrinomonadaceae bacterium]|jgi:hypothetical protein|nr:hypothetical protein [Pyrinomonadaceae bacterium]